MVAWFAGLFYMPRLFIYHVEAGLKPEAEKDVLQNQFKIMSRRLWYIITWPGMVLTLLCGTGMIISSPSFIDPAYNASANYYMYVKLGLVLLLIGYQLMLQVFFNRQQKGTLTISSTALRIWNEVATLLLIAIIFVVVFKGALDWVYGALGLLGTAIALMIAIKLYKRQRKKNGEAG